MGQTVCTSARGIFRQFESVRPVILEMVLAMSFCLVVGLRPHGTDPWQSVVPQVALFDKSPAGKAFIALINASFVILLATLLTYLFATCYCCYAKRAMHLVTGCALASPLMH